MIKTLASSWTRTWR